MRVTGDILTLLGLRPVGEVLQLVEIVRGKLTSDQTVEIIGQVVKRTGKHPIVLQKEAIGFVMNRMQLAAEFLRPDKISG